MDVVVVGASGHGREVMEILNASKGSGAQGRTLGFIDDDTKKHGSTVDGLPVLGGFEWFENRAASRPSVVCAVGDPHVLKRLATRAHRLNLTFARAVSSLALISPSATIGKGAVIFPHVVVNTGASIGEHVTLNVGATVSHDARVGDYSNINPAAHLAGNVTVEEGCYIGMGSCLIQNVTVGAWSVIGAGSIVIEDIPPFRTAVGNPARVIKVHPKAS